MRILHLTRDLPPASKGGISIAVGGLLRALGEGGDTCGALSFDGWRPSRDAGRGSETVRDQLHGAPVVRVSGPDGLHEAAAFAGSFRPDVLHVHHGMLWPFAATLRETLAVPALFTVHVHQAALNRLRGVTERTMSLDGQERALVEADAVLTPSLSCTASVRTDHPERPIFTTPLGVFDSDAARAAVDGRTERCRDTVLYVGRFADIKGTEDFFEVARRVLAKRPASRAVVVGGVPDNPKAERRWRRRWEEGTSPTLVERLRFEGWCTPAALSVHLAAARVLVVPSWTETFGLTVLEAMLHATPVVASACPAIAELLDDGRTGLLAPVRDVAALVGCVERLLDDDELAVTLGHQAAVRARAVHRWAQTVHGTRMAYRSATLTQPA